MKLWIIELIVLAVSGSLIAWRFCKNRRIKKRNKQKKLLNESIQNNEDLKQAVDEVNNEFPSSRLSITHFLDEE